MVPRVSGIEGVPLYSETPFWQNPEVNVMFIENTMRRWRVGIEAAYM